MKRNIYLLPKVKKSSYLIGDSKKHGKDQVLSGTLQYNHDGLFDESNTAVIDAAKAQVLEGGFTNIRIVTVWYDCALLKTASGFTPIDYKEHSRNTKRFSLDNPPKTWRYE